MAERACVDTVVTPELLTCWEDVEPLRLDPATVPISAETAPALGGASDLSKVDRIDLELLPEEFRLQRMLFRAARKLFDELRDQFHGNEAFLTIQLVRLVEEFLNSDRLVIPSAWHSEPSRKRILLILQIDEIVQHLCHLPVRAECGTSRAGI